MKILLVLFCFVIWLAFALFQLARKESVAIPEVAVILHPLIPALALLPCILIAILCDRLFTTPAVKLASAGILSIIFSTKFLPGLM